MRGKRALLVRFVKPETDETASEDDFDEFADKAVVITDIVDGFMKKAIAGALLYVVADTVRKIAIAQATK